MEIWVRVYVFENGDVKDDDEEIYYNVNKIYLSLVFNDVVGYDFIFCSGIDFGNRCCLVDYFYF